MIHGSAETDLVSPLDAKLSSSTIFVQNMVLILHLLTEISLGTLFIY